MVAVAMAPATGLLHVVAEQDTSHTPPLDGALDRLVAAVLALVDTPRPRAVSWRVDDLYPVDLVADDRRDVSPLEILAAGAVAAPSVARCPALAGTALVLDVEPVDLPPARIARVVDVCPRRIFVPAAYGYYPPLRWRSFFPASDRFNVGRSNSAAGEAWASCNADEGRPCPSSSVFPDVSATCFAGSNFGILMRQSPARSRSSAMDLSISGWMILSFTPRMSSCMKSLSATASTRTAASK